MSDVIEIALKSLVVIYAAGVFGLCVWVAIDLDRMFSATSPANDKSLAGWCVRSLSGNDEWAHRKDES